MYYLIVAVDRLGGFAKNGSIPWNLPEDLKFFREMTRDTPGKNYLVMGRATWGPINKPLPKRSILVLTKNPPKENQYDPARVKFISDLNEITSLEGNVWICGGQEIYRQFIEMELPHVAYITIIDDDYQCDRFIPKEYLEKVIKSGTVINEITETDLNTGKEVKEIYYQHQF